MLVRMAIISLRVHVNVKTPFLLLYNPLTIQNLSKFPKVGWGAIGISVGGIAPCPPPPLATALNCDIINSTN